MAGIKGKSGAKKGQGKGMTNNPAGRPVGSKNKMPNQVKKVLEDIFLDSVEELKNDIKNIESPAVRAKLFIEIGKMFVSRPLNEEEKSANADINCGLNPGYFPLVSYLDVNPVFSCCFCLLWEDY
jgi:hypothetical protein